MLLFRKYMAWCAALQGVKEYTGDNISIIYDGVGQSQKHCSWALTSRWSFSDCVLEQLLNFSLLEIICVFIKFKNACHYMGLLLLL